MRSASLLLAVLMIFGVLVCGCTSSDTKSADAESAPVTTAVVTTTITTAVTTPEPTAPPAPKYVPGDIVAILSDEDSFGRIILDFNESSREYQIDGISKNYDGSWGHKAAGAKRTWRSRVAIEHRYSNLIDHIDLDSFTVDDPTIPEPEPITIKIGYSGSWSGSYGDLGSTESVDGSGSRTITIDNPYSFVGAVIQKSDDSSRTLKVKIMRGDKVLKEGSTSAAFGLVSVTISV